MYDNHKVKSLHIMLPKSSTYVKSYYGQTKWMYFLIEDDDLLEKYNTIWDIVSADVKKEFGSKTAYKKEFLKTKYFMVMKFQFLIIKKFQRNTLVILA